MHSHRPRYRPRPWRPTRLATCLTACLTTYWAGLAGLAWLVVGAACSSPAVSPGTVEIGTGRVAFEPVYDGQDLDLIAGPQGGFHFLAHVRMAGLEPGDHRVLGDAANPTTWFRAFSETGDQVDIPEIRQLGYRDTEDGWHALPSARLLRVFNEKVPALYGRPVRLQVTVEDASGNSATDEVWVVAQPLDGTGGSTGTGTAAEADDHAAGDGETPAPTP